MNNLDWQWKSWQKSTLLCRWQRQWGCRSWHTFSFIQYKEQRGLTVVAMDTLLCWWQGPRGGRSWHTFFFYSCIMNNLDRQWWPWQKCTPLCRWQGPRGCHSWHTFSFIHHNESLGRTVVATERSHFYTDGKDQGVVTPDILFLSFTIMNNLDWHWWPWQKSTLLC